MAASIPILSDIFGKKPEVIPFHPIDYGESQLKSIMENLKAFPQIQALGNQFQDYMTSAYNKAIPNFSALLDMGGKTTQEILSAAEPLLRGEIPQDVKAQIMRSGAFQALGKGGQFISSLQARDLGRTSLDLLNQGTSLAGAGASAAQHWAGLASGLIMSPSGFLITPAQQANLDLQQKLIKRDVAQQAANIAAAPNPIAKGLSDLVAYLTASYIGHGPAGQPPKATDYTQQSIADSATASTAYPGGPQDPAWASIMEDGGAGSAAPGGGSGLGPYYDPAALPGTTGAGFSAGVQEAQNQMFAENNPGFGYGVGYPASDVNAYYGGTATPQAYPQTPYPFAAQSYTTNFGGIPNLPWG